MSHFWVGPLATSPRCFYVNEHLPAGSTVEQLSDIMMVLLILQWQRLFTKYNN